MTSLFVVVELKLFLKVLFKMLCYKILYQAYCKRVATKKFRPSDVYYSEIPIYIKIKEMFYADNGT